MKKAFKPAHLIIALLLTLLLGATAGFAWFAVTNYTDPNIDKATIVTQYFHCGSGTESDPFVITRPIHYYNLVELFQRKAGFADVVNDYHFQLGYDLDDDPETLEFYNYTDGGDPVTTDGNRYSTTLNLQYYSGDNALLPIGTSDVPFNAEFNGNGLTVANLHVKTTEAIGDQTFGTSDVGIFGYVGESAVIKDAYFKNITIDLSGTDATRTAEGHNTDVHKSEGSQTADLVFVGYIAGHVKIGSTVQNVYVNNCTIEGGDAARSGYGYFGCVEDPDGAPVQTLGSEIATLRAAGDDAGFGGSLDMKKLHQRLVNIWSAQGSAVPSNYVSSEVVRIDNVNLETTVDDPPGTTTFTAVTNSSDTYNYHHYTTREAGSYFYYQRTSMTNYNFMCLYGEGSRYPKTVVTYTYENEFTDAWYIKDGNTYLAVSGTSLSTAATQEGAAKWMVDGSGHLYTAVETENSITNYYLNRNGTTGVTLSTAANTVWNRTASDADTYTSDLYTVYNETNYYLDYNGGWTITPYNTHYKISDGQGHYLSGTAVGVANAASADAAAKWFLSDPDGSTTAISTYINGTVYYLSCTGTLGMSTSPTTWTKDGSRYYVTVQGVRYDLVFDTGDNTWKVVPASGKKITGGNGHYLTADTSGVSDATLSGSVVWQFSSATGDTQIYTMLSGEKYYLTYNNTDGLTVSTTPATWHRSGNAFYYTSGTNKDYYLTYNNGWSAVGLTYYTIHDNNNHYLQVTGADTFDSGAAGNATHFYFSNEAGVNSSGTVYCIVGGTPLYLRNNNGTLATTEASGSATTWTNNGSGQIAASGTIYRIGYDGGWKLINTATYWTVSDDSGHYLNNNGTSGVTASGDPTHWSYSNNRISIQSGNTTYYLRINVTTTGGGCGGQAETTYSLVLGTEDSNSVWNRDNNNHYYVTIGNTNYYIRYNNNAWGYVTGQGNAAPGNATPLNITSHTDNPLAYVAEQSLTAPEVTVENHTGIGTAITLTGPQSEQITFERTQYQTVTKTAPVTKRGGYQTYFPLRITESGDSDYVAANPYKVSNKNTGYVISAANIEDTNADTGQKLAGDIRVSYFPIINVGASCTMTISNGSNYLCINNNRNGVTNSTSADSATKWRIVVTNVNGNTVTYSIYTTVGTTNYYLSATRNSLTISNTSVSWTYNATNRRLYTSNGYYIRYNNGWTGTNTANSATALTLRVADADTIYTVNDSGVDQTPTATDVFNQALLQLEETLQGSDSVYGLHFMDSAISTTHLITAPYASVFGQNFTNYEMPEDSIDFHVIERGTISFFAGNYFTNNDAFFSLHMVIRYTAEDEEVKTLHTKRKDQIKAIKEITEVYQHATNGNKTPYIYKFSDNTYSNADGSYTGATTLNPAYNSTPVFKTSWITNPGISTGNRLYYFEIPCNAGEYCLGSVSRKTGAYLVYLDIATNGGDVIDSAISSTGNDVVDSFHVDVRESPDTVTTTILQFSVSAPDNVSASDFSVNVTFDPTQTASPHTSGLYTVNVVNRSSEDLTLYVYLCDDDFNLMTAFPYAYKVIYTNGTHTETTLSGSFGDAWQMMAGFTIPATGEASELSYH